MFDWNLPKQTILHGSGRTGDCWRCCVAAIVRRPALEVPHFAEANGGAHYEADTQRWLNQNGFVMLAAKPEFIVHGWHGDPLILPIISTGPTTRSKRLGQHHAVVTIQGQVVYDPHPDGSGLTAIIQQFVILPNHRDRI